MPLIRVVYRANEYGFDYVTRELLDSLITQDEITHFYRPSERRWVNTKLDPVRGNGGGYQGPDRRGKDNRPKAIAGKSRLKIAPRSSDWLEGLWRLIESH